MSKSRNTSTATVPPALQHAYLDNLTGAREVADLIGKMGPRQFAGFTPDYYTGQDMMRGAAVGEVGKNAVSAAENAARSVANYNPMQVTGQGYEAALANAAAANRSGIKDVAEERITAANMDRTGVRDVTGGSFLDMNLGNYMNPFLQNVASNVVNDMGRARQMQLMGNADQAAAARAFGGSRQGVLEAETNRNFYDRMGNTLSNLYATGFDAASNMAGQDLNRGMQAALANQGVDFNVGSLNTANLQQAGVQNAANNLQAILANQGIDRDTSFLNANLTQQANLANALAQNQARQFSAEATNAAALANQAAGLQGGALNLAGAQNLANIGMSQQDMAFNNAEALMGLGEAQRGFNQNLLDAPRSLLLEQQDIRNQATGLYPGIGTNSRSNSFSILS
jgi:hypothetical protein